MFIDLCLILIKRILGQQFINKQKQGELKLNGVLRDHLSAWAIYYPAIVGVYKRKLLVLICLNFWNINIYVYNWIPEVQVQLEKLDPPRSVLHPAAHADAQSTFLTFWTIWISFFGQSQPEQKSDSTSISWFSSFHVRPWISGFSQPKNSNGAVIWSWKSSF